MVSGHQTQVAKQESYFQIPHTSVDYIVFCLLRWAPFWKMH